MKKKFLIALSIGLMMPMWVLNVHADATTTDETQASATAVSTTCGITEDDLATIQAIQNNTSLSYLDELQQELSIRKSLLSKTIQCAEADAIQAKANLDAASVDPGLEGLRNQWSDRLNDATAYYELELQKVNGAGISGTESIAKEVLAWRENNYTPLAVNVLNFITWSENQTLFTTAESRLAEVKNLITSPLFSESPDVQNDFEDAAVSLRSAEDENTSAKNAFAQSLPPDQTLLFIQQSLDALSSTYQHFFDVSTLIQSLLPH